MRLPTQMPMPVPVPMQARRRARPAGAGEPTRSIRRALLAMLVMSAAVLPSRSFAQPTAGSANSAASASVASTAQLGATAIAAASPGSGDGSEIPDKRASAPVSMAPDGTLAQVPIPLAMPPAQSADLAALQRGARMYANFCASCHAARQVQIGQLAQLGFSSAEISASLNPNRAPMSGAMSSAMPAAAAKAAFGLVPPDLSLITREKGATWVYTYLRSFYTDPARPMGANNLLVPGVAMPDVLAGLHGPRLANFTVAPADAGKGTSAMRTFAGYQQLAPGSVTPAAFDAELADLVAYLDWMADPSAPTRHALGPWVLGFLAIFTVSAWRLVRAYWSRATKQCGR